MMDTERKVAVITGASQGIGAALVKAYRDQNYRVVATARSKAKQVFGSDPQHIPPELLNEMYLTGNRRGHYRAFISLLRNAESWEAATKTYSKIGIPVLLLWGDRDWSRPDEWEHERQIVPGASSFAVGRASPLSNFGGIGSDNAPDEVCKWIASLLSALLYALKAAMFSSRGQAPESAKLLRRN
jgi:pimeloyl-ACP methyl ester carboxylesterase